MSIRRLSTRAPASSTRVTYAACYEGTYVVVGRTTIQYDEDTHVVVVEKKFNLVG